MKKIEYFTLKPSLKQFFGRTVNKKLKFDEWTDDKKIHQTMSNGILTTEINDTKTIKMFINGEEKSIEQEEKSVIKQKIPTGIILIWDEIQGYIIPSYEMATLDEIEKDLIAMKEVYKGDEDDTERNENKNI